MITDILPGVFAAVGARERSGPLFADPLGIAERLGPARRAVVLLVDGLGFDLLPRAARHAPVFDAVVTGSLGRLARTSATLPSTTPTSLVSLGTAVEPGEHGVLGFTLNVPGTDRLLTHIFWRDDPDPARWVPVPTVYQRADVPAAVVLPAMFGGSGLTVAAYSGAQFVGLHRGDDIVEATRHALNGDARVVLTYTSLVDTAAHEHGIASTQWADAALRVGTLLERLLAALPEDTALLVTADHGGLDVPAAGRVDLDADPRLSAGLRVVAGEPRFRHLHTTPGAAPDVQAAWTDVLGERAAVYSRDQAVSAGLFGPVAPAHLPRIGDVVVVAEGDTVVLASRREPPEITRLVGFHGARTHAETAIPVITFPVA